MIGGKAEENHNMINESLNNIDETLNNIEKFNSEVINKIEYDPKNLSIPSFLTTSTNDSNAHKIAIAKEDINLYNEKYKELSEISNELSQKTFDSIKEISEPIKNMKIVLDEISEEFDEVMKSLSLPLILEQKGLIDTSESNLRRLEIDEFMDDYKKMIKEFNDLYHRFLTYIITLIDTLIKEIDKIMESAYKLNDSVNEGITTFIDMVENTDLDNVHEDLIETKNHFLNIKEEFNVRKNSLDKSISNCESLYSKMDSDLKYFQDNFDMLTENITEISNLIISKTREIKKFEFKGNKDCSLDLYSKIKPFFYVYRTIITIQYQTKDRLIKVTTIIDVEIKTSLDLLFIIDVTGSMGPYINEVKKKLIDIMNRTIDQSPGIGINLGFIAYRDEGDNYTEIDFTQDHNNVKAQIEDIYAIGGGDLPEDVSFAFKAALNKTWTSNAKFIVFVTDAPSHGEKDIEESIEKLAKNNISMFCLRIHNRTDSMFNSFKNIYNKYKSTVFKIVEKRFFIDEVVNSCIEYYSTHRNS